MYKFSLAVVVAGTWLYIDLYSPKRQQQQIKKLEMHLVDRMYLRQRCSDGCRVTRVWTYSTVTPFSPYPENILLISAWRSETHNSFSADHGVNCQCRCISAHICTANFRLYLKEARTNKNVNTDKLNIDRAVIGRTLAVLLQCCCCMVDMRNGQVTVFRRQNSTFRTRFSKIGLRCSVAVPY